MAPSNRDIGRSLLTGVLLGTLLAAIFAGGFFLRDLIDPPSRVAASGEEANYTLLDEVQALLDAHYVRTQPAYALRQYGAIRGMLSTLNDPFTFFIDPPVAASESQVLAGTYGGIGVQIVRAADGSILLYPFDDSPAAAAGVSSGDMLIAVNGAPVDVNLGSDALDQMLRGEVREGSGVEITIQKADSGERLTLFVPFAVINVPSVTWRVMPDDSRLGYVQILRFTNRTPNELQTAMNELNSAGIAGLVLDLRNNAGGLLSESISVADEFLDTGTLLVQRDSTGEEIFSGNRGGAAVDLPLIVLVNHGTASGAELVAGAIQDRGRGILIGQTTYGKGTVQQIFPLSDGSSLHVTSSEWFTPSYQPLDGAGLSPDIFVEPDAAGRDLELAEAVRHLQEQLGTSS